MTDSSNIGGYSTLTNRTKTVLSLVIYCISGTFLTLVNKLAVIAFPYPNMLLVIQNGVAVFLLLLISKFCRQAFGSLPLISLTIFKLWLPLVFLFVIMLMSSLVALTYVSVPTVIVMRNFTTLIVAILEYVLLNNKTNCFSVTTLIFMLLGAVLYAKHDFTFSIQGYIWLCANILGTSVYQIYIKKIIHLPIFENVGSIGMSYYNNLISLPILLISTYIMGELTTLLSGSNMKYLLGIKPITLILLSGILGFSLSVSAFALNKQISATSMMVANNVNKFSVIVVSEIFVQSTLDIMASIGGMSVLCLGWLYSQTMKPPSKKLFITATFIFVTLGTTIGYKYINNSIMNTGIMNTGITNNETDEIYRSYLPVSKLSNSSFGKSPGIMVKKTTKYELPGNCVIKNSSIWKICEVTRCAPYTEDPNWSYPHTTVSGEKTGEFINHVLEVAWGSNPPSIDLYVRSGCHGIMEMKHLFKSIEIFWPRFLGSVIVVLDAGDEEILKYLLPVKPTHHYVISFEYTPCLPGRVFNQYSYLNLDRHSSADYVVTVDSDCIFHSPVTPDLIFRQGKVILASSRTFQKDLWIKSLDSVMGAGMYDGHYMVTQPVTLSLATFSSFRRWFYNSKGKCYEDHLSQLSPDNYYTFCWMCQLGTYLERGSPEKTEYNKYWFQHLDNSIIEPMMRYSIHLTYEPFNSTRCHEPKCYEQSANEVIKQGLCRAFCPSVFHFCANYSHLDYIYSVTFLYAHTEIQAADQNARMNAVTRYLKRLSHVTTIVLNRSKKA